MKVLKLSMGVLYMLVSLAAPRGFGDSTAKIRLVTKHNPRDQFRSFLFHNQKLFIGKTFEGKLPYRIEVWDEEGKMLLGYVPIEHSVRELISISQNTIAVVGTSLDPWRTHVTEIKLDNLHASLKKHTFPANLQAQYAAYHSNHWMVTEPGSRSIFWGGSLDRIGALEGEYSAPGRPEASGDYFWLVEERNFSHGDERILRIHASTRKVDYILNKGQGLKFIRYHEKLDLCLVPESDTGLLLLVDEKTGQLRHRISVGGHPVGIASYGSCAVLSDPENKDLIFVDLEDHETIQKVSIAVNDVLMSFPMLVQANEQSGTVFVRNPIPCFNCSESQSSVYAIEMAQVEEVMTRCF